MEERTIMQEFKVGDIVVHDLGHKAVVTHVFKAQEQIIYVLASVVAITNTTGWTKTPKNRSKKVVSI